MTQETWCTERPSYVLQILAMA